MDVRDFRYRVVDVFTEHALEGNALAVFPEADGLDGGTMQRIAKELNLSETTFVFPSERPGCAARVRIFTAAMEMRFAGHPTIGTAWVLLDEGRIMGDRQRFALDEQIGAVPIRSESGDKPMVWLRTPPIEEGPVVPRDRCAEALGIDPGDLLDFPAQVLSAGNPTLYIPLRTVEAVDNAWVDMGGYRALGVSGPTCVFVFAPVHSGAYSRMFAPEHGVVEDPATGSSTGPLAAYMMRHGLVSSENGTRFVSEQGKKMGRRSLLHVEIHGPGGRDGIDVGGHVTPLITATMRLPLAETAAAAIR